MVTDTLVKSQIEDAGNLLDALKKEQFPMTAAFWKYLPDAETWRLVIATEKVDDPGPIGAYTNLQTLLNKMPEDISEEFSVANITLLSPQAEQLKQLKKQYKPVPWKKSFIRRISLSSDEAYIYFME